ncbi:inorganic phosphate transporter [Marinihelvus fidelis]|uniref:Phosphate transporter n=1 Tax=Marinihelvus fidelis TaxID=2613842 RepID=A0A5N0T5Y8_9GAMM|nr:inorganic phosphate transporter [Marinihelvus fidelis]KAA9129864.1 inorganic phosphate transporter [Marinihelvus fidelis]
MDHATIYLVLAAAFGLFMAWGIGANDVANAMATSVGAKALTIKQAIIVAAIFEFAGAFLAGGQVTATIRKGIVDSEQLSGNPEYLVFGMLSALLAAGIWLAIASRRGWPVSTTHSIVGAIVGFAIAGIGMEAVKWGQVSSIAASWVVSPLVSGFIAFLIFLSVQKLILRTDNPIANARRYVPMYIFFVGFILSLVTLFKGLKHINLDLSVAQSYAIAVGCGLVTMAIGIVLIGRLKIKKKADKDFRFTNVEKIFGVLMIFTACGMAFAHGSNDVANAIGPVAAIVSVVASGEVSQSAALPTWVLLLGALGIVFGLATYGFKVIRTVGQRITELTPSRGFAAELAAATTVVIASGTGIPISTTHTLVGAVLGVGFARGMEAINLRVVGNIFLSWIVTLPAGAILAVFFFYTLKGMFTP